MRKRVVQMAIAAALVIGVHGGARAASYMIDPVHSYIGFSVSHLGISQVKGHFKDFAGKLQLDPGAATSLTARATIKVASIDTGNTRRDQHLASADFFNTAEFGEISFVSQGSEQAAGQTVLVGTFTMHGVAKELRLPLKMRGPVAGPDGKARMGLSASATIDRHDYGVGSDKMTDKMVGRSVTLEIEIEAIVE